MSPACGSYLTSPSRTKLQTWGSYTIPIAWYPIASLGELTVASVFSLPWQKIVSSAEAIADSHHTLASKIEADVERPLRDFDRSNREIQNMSTIGGNLAAMAKEIDGANKKAEKLRDKGAKASAGKVANASSDVENAMSQWESQAPYVFEQLQAADESRVNVLRDILTQFQTHEVDQVERSRVTAEQCLHAVLNIETADEIKTFALRTAQGKPKIERPPLFASELPREA